MYIYIYLWWNINRYIHIYVLHILPRTWSMWPNAASVHPPRLAFFSPPSHWLRWLWAQVPSETHAGSSKACAAVLGWHPWLKKIKLWTFLIDYFSILTSMQALPHQPGSRCRWCCGEGMGLRTHVCGWLHAVRLLRLTFLRTTDRAAALREKKRGLSHACMAGHEGGIVNYLGIQNLCWNINS